MNVDVAFFPNGMEATAADLRNDHGQAIDGGSWLFEYVLDTTIAEAMALLKELVLAENLGCFMVIFDSVSLEVVQACNGEMEVSIPY